MSWFNLQETRAYPIADDNAVPEIERLFVDLQIVAPAALGLQPQILSLMISDLVVSLVVGIDGQAVASLTVERQDLVVHQPLTLASLSAGVSVQVIFGSGVNDLRLQVTQLPLVVETLQSYDGGPGTPTLRPRGAPMNGVVTLQVAGGVTIEAREVEVDLGGGDVRTVRAAVFGLDPNRAHLPVGGCRMSAESNVDASAIVELAGVRPDAQGNIQIEVLDVRELPNYQQMSVVDAPGSLTIRDPNEPCSYEPLG